MMMFAEPESIIIFMIPIIIIVALVFLLHAKGNGRHFAPELKGEIGEIEVSRVLGHTVQGVQYIIDDLLFSVGEGKTCQIDHIYINTHGVWVIETKNYAGYIYGDSNRREWTQVMAYGNVKNKFYNPIKQNATHIYHLSELLNIKNVFLNVVCFLNEANIDNVNAEGVFSLQSLYAIKHFQSGIMLSAEDMESIYNKLIEAKENSTATIREHVSNIHKMQQNIDDGICPRCEGKLLLRTHGDSSFWGCSNYPRCKFTKKCDK